MFDAAEIRVMAQQAADPSTSGELLALATQLDLLAARAEAKYDVNP